MRVLMFTNTYLPHVGGVARSVDAFAEAYRAMGHQVFIVAPEFAGQQPDEYVHRVPAIQRFNGSDFSVRLPASSDLKVAVTRFNPDIIHAHHPFLLGDTALRFARERHIPLVFTHHTMYERYTHYVPGDSDTMKEFVIHLASGYCNLCDAVFAPSQSVANLLQDRGVTRPIHVVPTGVKLETFDHGSGPGMRQVMGIPEDAFVIGHLGRLAPEKGLDVISKAVRKVLEEHADAHFLLAGEGPSLDDIASQFRDEGLIDRFHHCGVVVGDIQVSAYKAMDVFAFASKSETQGMVLTEAMAARVPVVAFDASGVRDVLVDKENGRMLAGSNPDDMAEAIDWIRDLPGGEAEALRARAYETAKENSMQQCAQRAIDLYKLAIDNVHEKNDDKYTQWESAIERLKAEWNIIANAAEAARNAFSKM